MKCWFVLSLITFQMLWRCWSVSVNFPYKEPVYVTLNRTLVLQAKFEVKAGETIQLVTWDRNGPPEVRLVTDKRAPDPRISVEMNGALLRLTGVNNNDYGLYTVTITDQNGDQVSASVEVRNITRYPVAFLSIDCNMETMGAQWDNPVYSWWVDEVPVTNQTHTISANGRKLILSGSLGDNYACVIESGQGTSKAQAQAQAQEPCPDRSLWDKAMTAVVVIETILLVAVLCWVIKLWCKKDKQLGTSY